MPLIIIKIITSYLIGSIPTAYIFGRLLKDIDIRKSGSGNVGATNAMRVLGMGPGITVLALDILKGALPVVLLGHGETLSIAIGVACIVGHNWTLFLQFKGGKGVATTLGVLIGLAFRVPGLNIILGLVLASWIAAFLLTRIVSLASCVAALALPVASILLHASKFFIMTCIILSAFVILRHKSNLSRIFQGKEKKIF